MDYLLGFRSVARIPVENDTELRRVVPEGDLLRLEIADAAGPRAIAARRLVLAGGVLTSGGPEVPRFVAEALPRDRWAHSSDAIDFTRLRGARVAVLGAGASAFDNAAVALEHGAAAVHLFARRAAIDQASGKGALEFTGFLRHFGELPDDAKWRIMRRLATFSVPPPPSSVARCEQHPGFRVSTSCPWTRVVLHDETIGVDTPRGAFAFDFAILATGFRVELAARPELDAIGADIARWSDVYAPPTDETSEMTRRLGCHPYLGAHFEFRPKAGHNAPWLARIHDFGLASVQSLGPVTVGLNGMKYGPSRLVQGISRSLFLEDAALHEAAFACGDFPAEVVI
jgi:cation diffusion facilitator CzcD-associated flavoprotein CzcO